MIVGHSLGGSIGCRITDKLTNGEKLDRVVGCIVIDVVEGTAIEALPFMNQIIADRPKHFDSLDSAIKWWYNQPLLSYTSCTLKKLESARVSTPPQLVEYEKNGQKRWGWKVKLKETEKFWMGKVFVIQGGSRAFLTFSSTSTSRRSSSLPKRNVWTRNW